MQRNVQRAEVLIGQSRFPEAIGELRQALGSEPNDPQLHALLSLCLAETEAFDEATAAARQAIHLGPDVPLAHLAHAKVLADRRHFPEAQAAAEQAIRLDPHDARSWSLLAGIAIERRDWPGALQAAERGLAIDPEHVGCTNLRAMSLVKLGRREQAGATIDAALRRDPEDALSHANRGWTLLHAREPDKAMIHFREALRLDPNLDWARAGIVEALKARNFIYRWMLTYFLWMSRLSTRVQWGIIIGAYVGNRVLREVADENPALAPFIYPLLILYFVFVVLTWIADPLFNLLLRLNRFGRLALSREQIVASNWVGACLLLALASLATWLVTQADDALISGLVLGLLVMPLAGIFKCDVGWPRLAMAGYTLLLTAIGLAAMMPVALLVRLPAELALGLARLRGPALTLFVLGIVLSGVVGNFLNGVQPRR